MSAAEARTLEDERESREEPKKKKRVDVEDVSEAVHEYFKANTDKRIAAIKESRREALITVGMGIKDITALSDRAPTRLANKVRRSFIGSTALDVVVPTTALAVAGWGIYRAGKAAWDWFKPL